jgi:hypothetical protein
MGAQYSELFTLIMTPAADKHYGFRVLITPGRHIPDAHPLLTSSIATAYLQRETGSRGGQ